MSKGHSRAQKRRKQDSGDCNFCGRRAFVLVDFNGSLTWACRRHQGRPASDGVLTGFDRWVLAGLRTEQPERGITMGPNGLLVVDPKHPNSPLRRAK